MVTTYKLNKRQRALLISIYEAKGTRELASDENRLGRELGALGLATTRPAVFPGIGTEATLTLAGVGVAWNLINPNAGDDEPVKMRDATPATPGERLPWSRG